MGILCEENFDIIICMELNKKVLYNKKSLRSTKEQCVLSHKPPNIPLREIKRSTTTPKKQASLL